jgi:hypothetical protein
MPGLYGSGGTVTAQSTQQFVESLANINAAATFTGASHSGVGFSRFRAQAFLDQPGTITVQQSRDGSTWRSTLTQGVPTSSSTIVESIVSMAFIRAQLTNNGGSATTVVDFTSELVAI